MFKKFATLKTQKHITTATVKITYTIKYINK